MVRVLSEMLRKQDLFVHRSLEVPPDTFGSFFVFLESRVFGVLGSRRLQHILGLHVDHLVVHLIDDHLTPPERFEASVRSDFRRRIVEQLLVFDERRRFLQFRFQLLHACIRHAGFFELVDHHLRFLDRAEAEVLRRADDDELLAFRRLLERRIGIHAADLDIEVVFIAGDQVLELAVHVVDQMISAGHHVDDVVLQDRTRRPRDDSQLFALTGTHLDRPAFHQHFRRELRMQQRLPVLETGLVLGTAADQFHQCHTGIRIGAVLDQIRQADFVELRQWTSPVLAHQGFVVLAQCLGRCLRRLIPLGGHLFENLGIVGFPRPFTGFPGVRYELVDVVPDRRIVLHRLLVRGPQLAVGFHDRRLCLRSLFGRRWPLFHLFRCVLASTLVEVVEALVELAECGFDPGRGRVVSTRPVADRGHLPVHEVRLERHVHAGVVERLVREIADVPAAVVVTDHGSHHRGLGLGPAIEQRAAPR
nr:hypothetical protein [Nocardia suismassiliense]